MGISASASDQTQLAGQTGRGSGRQQRHGLPGQARRLLERQPRQRRLGHRQGDLGGALVRRPPRAPRTGDGRPPTDRPRGPGARSRPSSAGPPGARGAARCRGGRAAARARSETCRRPARPSPRRRRAPRAGARSTSSADCSASAATSASENSRPSTAATSSTARVSRGQHQQAFVQHGRPGPRAGGRGRPPARPRRSISMTNSG